MMMMMMIVVAELNFDRELMKNINIFVPDVLCAWEDRPVLNMEAKRIWSLWCWEEANAMHWSFSSGNMICSVGNTR